MRAKAVRRFFQELRSEKRHAAVRDNEMRPVVRDLRKLKKRERQRRRQMRRIRRERGR